MLTFLGQDHLLAFGERSKGKRIAFSAGLQELVNVSTLLVRTSAFYGTRGVTTLFILKKKLNFSQVHKVSLGFSVNKQSISSGRVL
eukprot:g62846.t1